MNEHLQAIVTVLSLVNPTICAALFSKATAGDAMSEKMVAATKASFAILIILVIATLVGIRLLHLFGVSLDAFMVAGGSVLSWMGFSMLAGSSSTDTKETKSLTPLILFAASPGTITGVITLSAAHTKLELPVSTLVAVGIAVASTWLILLMVAQFSGESNGGGFLKDTLSRFMGLIVLAMGVQFALTGLRAFMSASSLPGAGG
ncbi:MarC family protein [Kiritimatiellota bacterium B12222]|nr:MarC family protein [Kiritimatiellota bacterium B12222]